jgi:hypothetical protein
VSADESAVIVSYVEATARLTRMPLGADGVREVAAVMTRIARFASDVGAFALDDDVEIAGTGAP